MFKGLFDVQSRFAKIDKNGDPLLKINEIVDWSIFRPDLDELKDPEASGKGRKTIDALLKFKMLVLQSLYNLSDDGLEQQVLDRLSFMRFLGLRIGDDVPDATTIWLFREQLKKAGLVEKLFDRFGEYLNDAGFDARKGQIVDATIVKVPVRRDTREVNDKVKSGEAVDEWSDNTRAQKDCDADWTKKNGKSFFGYKNHVDADVEHKIIRKFEVTPASVNDTNVLEQILTPNADPSVYADSAYHCAKRIEEMLKPDSPYLPCISEKGCRHRKLTDEQRQANRERSRHRSRVEHIFGSQYQSTRGRPLLRGIGIARAKVKIGLRNLAYNITRFVALTGGIVS